AAAVKTDEYCKGRLCAKCGKCNDWHFTGDKATRDWIRSWENVWQKADWECYNHDHIYELFKKRDGATCHFDTHPPATIFHVTALVTPFSVYDFGGDGPGGGDGGQC
ncbi:unnamed protein product, partial [Rotaria sp. Silwood2]